MIQSPVRARPIRGSSDVKGPDIRDADGRARDGQDQGIEGIEGAAAGQPGAGENPRDGHAHGDAQRDGEAGVEKAVEDVLRRLHDHPLEVLQGVVLGQGRHCPARPPRPGPPPR